MWHILDFDGKLVDIGAAILGGQSITFRADLEANFYCALLVLVELSHVILEPELS